MAISKKRVARRRPRTARKSSFRSGGRNRRTIGVLKFVIPLVLIIAIIGGLGFMLLMGYQTATASSFFEIRSVEIHGLHRASHDEIENIVRMRSEKTGVWNADLAAIKSELEDLMFVKTAAVSRILPEGMRINIVERVPRAVVSTETKEFWVDEDAVVLSKFDREKEALQFLLKGWDESKTLEAVGENKERIKTYLLMLQEWQDFDLVKRVTEVDIKDLNEVKAVVKDSGEFVEITLGKDNFGRGLRNSLKAIANKGGEIKAFNVQNSVSQRREASK